MRQRSTGRPAQARPRAPDLLRVSSPLSPLLALQRTAGNRAVAWMLDNVRPVRPPYDAGTVQRRAGEIHPGCSCVASAGGDGQIAGATAIQRADTASLAERPPLTSPRFAGDAVLEACHQDRARLGQGAHGEPVTKVQQALIDLGFDLGPSGADAAYGPMTAAAVRSFKTREALGSEQFGDVGPGTMSRLDQLFPGAAPRPVQPPPEAIEEDGLSCPAEDDIVTAVEAEPVLSARLAAVEPAEAAGDTVGAPPLPGGILAAVDNFKRLANAKDAAGADDPGPNVSSFGQFYVFGQLSESVQTEIDRIGAAGDADSVAFAARARTAVDAISNRRKTADTIIGECDRIAAATTSPQKAAMQALLRSAGKGGAIDATLFAAFDSSPTNAMPAGAMVPFRSLRALKAVLSFDSSACGGHALRVAQRIKRKGGLVPGGGKGASVSARLATGRGFEDLRPMGSVSSTREPAATAGVDASSSGIFGDVIEQANVDAVASQMKAALNAGRTVHARVLSGLGYGVGTTATGKTAPNVTSRRIALGAPPEEHSLLVIGSDQNTAFVFHDPDAGVSHSPEPGFGMLFFDSGDGRLSTAENPSALAVEASGKHAGGDKRYQVISVQAV